MFQRPFIDIDIVKSNSSAPFFDGHPRQLYKPSYRRIDIRSGLHKRHILTIDISNSIFQEQQIVKVLRQTSFQQHLSYHQHGHPHPASSAPPDLITPFNSTLCLPHVSLSNHILSVVALPHHTHVGSFLIFNSLGRFSQSCRTTSTAKAPIIPVHQQQHHRHHHHQQQQHQRYHHNPRSSLEERFSFRSRKKPSDPNQHIVQLASPMTRTPSLNRHRAAALLAEEPVLAPFPRVGEILFLLTSNLP